MISSTKSHIHCFVMEWLAVSIKHATRLLPALPAEAMAGFYKFYFAACLSPQSDFVGASTFTLESINLRSVQKMRAFLVRSSELWFYYERYRFLLLVFSVLIFFIILVIYRQNSCLKITRNIASHNQTVVRDKPIFFTKSVNVYLDP